MRSEYDDIAEAYARHTASNPCNAYYDRPAILALAGDVSGRDVLEIGCAAGHLAKALAERGARVTGVDLSPAMVRLAELRVGDAATFHCADIAKPMPFLADESYDLVTASLVLHYLEDWTTALAELHRVLRPGGALVMSVHHPEDWHWFNRSNYFATELIVDRWRLGGREVEIRFYRRPLTAMFGALRSTGFQLDRLVEPMPTPQCEEADPAMYFNLTREPRFLYFVGVRRDR